jgi:hypothetical protein
VNASEFIIAWAIACLGNFLIFTGLVFWAWMIGQGIKRLRREWRMRRLLTAIRDQDAACN